MRCFTVYIDLTVFVHIARSHGLGVGILAAVSVSDFLHAFRATRFLLSLRGGLEARINEDTVLCTIITKCFPDSGHPRLLYHRIG